MGVEQSFERRELLEWVDQLLGRPAEWTTAPDGSQLVVAGDPPEVVVRVTAATITVSRYDMTWDGPHTPVVKPRRLAALNWRQLPASRTGHLLETLIDTAREQRMRTFRECRYCQRVFGPEHMHDKRTCHGCAERHLGVVH